MIHYDARYLKVNTIPLHGKMSTHGHRCNPDLEGDIRKSLLCKPAEN